jgi:hypothetical protein
VFPARVCLSTRYFGFLKIQRVLHFNIIKAKRHAVYSSIVFFRQFIFAVLTFVSNLSNNAGYINKLEM